jgi:hypothetical protein
MFLTVDMDLQFPFAVSKLLFDIMGTFELANLVWFTPFLVNFLVLV